ncbi:hypothetical protein [Pseudoduganella sp. R-34]|uniref:hypothetical protein n=1 Tax=Pseudoduganella sp. R-34 TaxID=3404062 RepID=UPI003CF3A210
MGGELDSFLSGSERTAYLSDPDRKQAQDRLHLSFGGKGKEEDAIAEEILIKDAKRKLAELDRLEAKFNDTKRQYISAAAQASRPEPAPITIEVSDVVADAVTGVGHGLQNLALGAAEPMLQVADVMQASLKMLHGSVTGDYESLTPLSAMGTQLGETGGGTSDGLLMTGKNVVSMLPPVAAAQVGWGVGSSLYKGDVAGVTENMVGGAAVFGGARAMGLNEYGFREVPVSSTGKLGRQQGAIGLQPYGPSSAGANATAAAQNRPVNSTRNGVTRTNAADWRDLRDHWDDLGYGDILSAANRGKIAKGQTPKVDDAWVSVFPEDAGLMGERISMHHIGGNPITVPLAATRHLNAHVPGGFRYNPGGPGSAIPFYPPKPGN